MKELSEETIEFLSKSGWTPERKVDVTEYVKAHEEAGCSVPEIVVEFLSNFGGLKINLPHKDFIEINGKKKMLSGKVHFDGFIAGDFCDDFKPYAEIVKVKNLYPIGEIGGQSLLFLDDFGRIYYEVGYREIYCFGRTIAEGLNKIVASRGNIR